MDYSKILIIGNAPLHKLPEEEYDLIFYFPNNSRLISTKSCKNVIAVIQDFTIDSSQWKCSKWGDVRKNKFYEYKKYFLPSYKTIIMNSGISRNYFKKNHHFNILNYISHKMAVCYLLKHIDFYSLYKCVGLRGLINYALLLTNLKKNIIGKYRPSSGFFILLYTLEKFPNYSVDLIGFSKPGEKYFVNESCILNYSPHVLIDSLIFNQKFNEKIKLIL